jgi:hypothetical protein
VTGQPALLLPGHETWATSALLLCPASRPVLLLLLGHETWGLLWPAGAAAAGIDRSGAAEKKDARKSGCRWTRTSVYPCVHVRQIGPNGITDRPCNIDGQTDAARSACYRILLGKKSPTHRNRKSTRSIGHAASPFAMAGPAPSSSPPPCST